MQIKWLPAALENLNNVAQHLNEHNPKAAQTFVQDKTTPFNEASWTCIWHPRIGITKLCLPDPLSNEK